jgi:hypothetical protein
MKTKTKEMIMMTNLAQKATIQTVEWWWIPFTKITTEGELAAGERLAADLNDL